MKNFFNESFNTTKNTLSLILFNIKPIILFVLFFVAFNLVGTHTIITTLFNTALYISNFKYIGPDNLFSFIFYPPNWILFIIAGILFSFFAIFEISGLTHAYAMSKHNKKTTFTGMILASINASNKSLLIRNWPIIIFVVIIFPLTGIITFSSATFCLKIPEFISDFLIANKLYCVLYTLLYIILLIIQIQFIFAFCFYTLGNQNFIEACKNSKKLIKNHYTETIISIILISLLFFILTTSISATISEVMSYFSNENSMFSRSSFSQEFQILFKSFLYAVYSPIFNVACLTMLFYKFIENNDELNCLLTTDLNDEKLKLNKIIWFLIILVSVFSIHAFLNINYFFPKNNEINIPHIVAHRGDSVRAPENTMPAIKLAADEENTFIEFDVHQTKDNVIIVSHDDYIKRVTGENLYVHDLTYDEIMKLDTGKWFNQVFENTRFSTLDEVLKFLKPYDITIQVEIKPTGFDPGLEENVVSIIKNNNMADRCMITCLKLEPLLKIEKFAPEIYTVYSMFIAKNRIETIPVDAYTIEANNVYNDMIENIHKANKKCFAWTVNTENGVQYLVDCNVDGILTDDPIMMRNALFKCDYDGGLKKAFRYYIKVLMEGI